MKNVLKVLLTLLMAMMLPGMGRFSLSAQELYPIACDLSEFEVSYIEDDGSLTKISCHSELSAAKKAMRENEDYVVRYDKSYSPSKIVAMNSGLAYTYPGRRNSSVMNLYQDPKNKDSSKYKTTYVSNHYEMTYVDTCGKSVYDISAAGKGYIQVVLNGFEGYTDLEYTDLVPLKFIKKGIPIYLGGRNTYESEDPFRVVLQQNYFELKVNGNYVDLVFHYYRAYPKSSSDMNCLSYSLTVDNGINYLKAGMETGKKYYSNDGINFYSDRKMNNKVATVYNYYQFLPLRSKTAIKASVFDNFLKSKNYSNSVMQNEGTSFIEAQNTYGCNALLVYAMACLESAYGTSWYAVNRYNLFGWAAYDDSPNSAASYSSVGQCINQQMGRNLSWFLDYKNSRYFGSGVGNKGAGVNVKYASDPYWGMKISSIAYAIDKYANGKNGKLTDHGQYTLGFVKNNYNDVLYDSNISWDPNFYKTSKGSAVLYTGRYGSHYQKDLTVVLLDSANGRYKVQSTNPVKDGAIVTDDGIIKYSWKDSVAWIGKDDVIVLYGDEFDPEEPEIDHDPLCMVNEMEIDGGVLHMEGIGLITGYDFSDRDKVSHRLHVYDLKSEEEVSMIVCETVDSDHYSINDGYDYTWAGFECEVDLSEMETGSYIFRLETILEGKGSEEILLKSFNDSLSFLAEEGEDRIFRVALNDLYGYRIELDILDTLLDYDYIRKPSARTSLVTLDKVSYEEADDTVYAVFEGLGMIYYLNYDVLENVHQLYLTDGEEVIEAQTESYACPFDYQSFYESSYDMEHICYRARVDLNELNKDYRLILEVSKDDQRDLLEICNTYGYQYPEYEGNGLKCAFLTDSVRYRLLINVDKEN